MWNVLEIRRLVLGYEKCDKFDQDTEKVGKFEKC